jgi:hypothetical protein
MPRSSFDWPPTSPTKELQSSKSNDSGVSLDRSRRRSLVPNPSPSPVLVSWASIVDEKRAEYSNSLNQIIATLQKRSISTQKSTLQTFTDVTITTITTRAMEITQDVINLQGFERKKFLEHLRLTQSLDLRTKHLWHQLISQLTHEYGVWFEASSYPKLIQQKILNVNVGVYNVLIV